MATVVGVVSPDVLKARQDASRRERYAQPLTHKPFAEALRNFNLSQAHATKAVLIDSK